MCVAIPIPIAAIIPRIILHMHGTWFQLIELKGDTTIQKALGIRQIHVVSSPFTIAAIIPRIILHMHGTW